MSDGVVWLDETRQLKEYCGHVTKAHPSPCDLCRVQPVPWLQVPAVPEPSPAREGEEDWTGSVIGREGRVEEGASEGGRGAERGEAGRFMP